MDSNGEIDFGDSEKRNFFLNNSTNFTFIKTYFDVGVFEIKASIFELDLTATTSIKSTLFDVFFYQKINNK
jgi:hypothetical protein